jgi:alpha-tubulin suppressor-like RCC1 family protein
VTSNLHFIRISAGAAHTCALDGTGAAYCWGEGSSGQLGNALSADLSSPSAVAGLSFQEISAGQDHTCAITLGGVAYCWGLNDQGQLGIGTQITRTVPVAVTGGLLFSGVSAGAGYSCGVTMITGVGYCWGEDVSGSLGAGGAVPQANPTPTLVLGGHTFTSITAGGGHTCGLVGGLTYCWGLNASGELGINSMVNQSAPFMHPAPHGIALLLPGLGDHACGLNGLSEIYCWGLNSSEQVGIAAGAPVTAPAMVPGWPR